MAVKIEDFKPSVELELRERLIADYVAFLRDCAGILADANAGKYGNTRPTRDVHEEGTRYEMAFAKKTNRYWSGAGGHFRSDDDVGGYQVRGTAHPNGRLLVRPSELDGKGLAARWVFVRGENPYQFPGWAWGWECAQPEFLEAPAGRPPAYFLPDEILRDLSKL